MNQKSARIGWGVLLLSVVVGHIGVAQATVLEEYTGPEITDALKNDQRACLAIGDAISCSAGMLNVLTGRGDTNKMTGSGDKWGFVVDSAQGDLKDRIVSATGGNASTDNGDLMPTDGAVEDGFKSNNAGDNFAATGKTSTLAGNLADPDNNGLAPYQDRAGTWDVGLQWLIDALTIDSTRRELMIMFDYNQSQNATGSLAYWSLITLFNYDDQGNVIGEINFEIGDFFNPLKNNFDNVADFTTAKTADSKPTASDFGIVNTQTCYLLNNGVVVDVKPITGGQCPAGYESVNNATGDNTTEIIAFLPELNANLEAYLAQGFDTLSVRMLFGCFGGTDSKSGQGYLADGSSTTDCDGGGNVDVYLMAAGTGTPNDVPEPGILSLLAMSLIAGASTRKSMN